MLSFVALYALIRVCAFSIIFTALCVLDETDFEPASRVPRTVSLAVVFSLSIDSSTDD